MKNIHVLPTDKPSRLYSIGETLILSPLSTKHENNIGRHIYITSDEEIKDIRPYKGKWQLEQGQILNKFPSYLTDLSECKLVIMTTDQDLIKDGVQAIDDEFLEWFVKNPSCEYVEIEESTLLNTSRTYLDIDKYKIIIPKEIEQQQGYSEEEMLKMLHKFGFDYTYNYKGEKTIYEWIPEWFEEYKRLEQLNK